jgi:16S rRNA (guanine966-N2)-methyltransferase
VRIISGELKGRSINFLKNSNTRPLKDTVRENIFNILEHSNLIKTKIENANILDLYSGIGSFGIECISRGADKVTFIEKDKNATGILNENLIKLSIKNKCKIHISTIEDCLAKNIKEQFHIFFFDPPFKDTDFIKNLETIKKKRIFRKNHIVIIHREKSSIDNFNDLLEIIEIKQYGRSKIIFGLLN